MTCFTTPDQLSMVLQQMFTTNKFTDIALRAGKDGEKWVNINFTINFYRIIFRIHAHKNVLAASLEYFDLMFSGPFKESSDQEIVFGEIETDILRAVVKFLYLGLVSIPDVKTAVDLWKVSHLMKISPLQDHALEYMTDNINSGNCLGVFFLAEHYELPALSSKAFDIAFQNFREVVKGDEFKHLSKDEMVKYIKSLKDMTEENEIAEAILEWLEFDESRHKLHFKELLRLLEINLINQQVLIDRLYSNYFDMDDSKYIMMTSHKVLLENTQNMLEPNPEILLLVNPLGDDKKALFFYNVAKDAFVGKTFLTMKGDVVGVWQSKLVILEYDDDLEKMKVTTYDLQKKETMIIGAYFLLCLFPSIIISENLYLLSFNFFMIINLRSGEYKKVSFNNFYIDDYVQFNNRPHFIVHNRNVRMNYWIATYQEDSNMWVKHKDFNDYENLIKGAAVVHNDCIYFFGDWKLTIYNPRNNTCTVGAKYSPVDKKSKRFKLASIQGKLFVGKDNTIQEYVDGELKPVSSKLNMLNGRYLELFTLTQ